MQRRKKRISDAVEGLPTRPTFASLHRIRILAKRLRYAAEAVGFVAGSRTATVAKAAERLQDVLGELNDAVCACRLLRRLRSRRELALAANAMLALEIEAVSRACAAWKPAWQKVAAAELPAWR